MDGTGCGDMENMVGAYSDPEVRNGFSVKSRSSTLGPNVLGLLFGLENGITWGGM